MKYISLNELPDSIRNFLYNIDRSPFGSEEEESKGMEVKTCVHGSILIGDLYVIESHEEPFSWLREWYSQNDHYPETS